MKSVLEKLNAGAVRRLALLNAPEGIAETVGIPSDVVVVSGPLAKNDCVDMVLGFATTLADVDSIAEYVWQATKGDALVWIAYPKGTSKRYRCEFNRDTGWAALGRAGFEGVRQVAVDDDWSALRFRRTEYIAAMTRESKRAISDAGKERTTKGQATANTRVPPEHTT